MCQFTQHLYYQRPSVSCEILLALHRGILLHKLTWILTGFGSQMIITRQEQPPKPMRIWLETLSTVEKLLVVVFLVRITSDSEKPLRQKHHALIETSFSRSKLLLLWLQCVWQSVPVFSYTHFRNCQNVDGVTCRSRLEYTTYVSPTPNCRHGKRQAFERPDLRNLSKDREAGYKEKLTNPRCKSVNLYLNSYQSYSDSILRYSNFCFLEETWGHCRWKRGCDNTIKGKTNICFNKLFTQGAYVSIK